MKVKFIMMKWQHLPGLDILIKMELDMKFEDPRSLLAKFRLVKEYGLGVLGCWHLGSSMPQTEEILLREFNVQ
jgi:hypothetical protein